MRTLVIHRNFRATMLGGKKLEGTIHIWRDGLTRGCLQSFRVGGRIRWTSSSEMGLELFDFAQAERAIALLDLKAVASAVAPGNLAAPTGVAA